jgi:hypothetical protein
MNVYNVLTKDYEQMDTWSIGKKQSQTNPNKAKFKKAKMNISTFITRNYEENTTNYELIKTKPIQSQNKPKQSQFKGKKMSSLLILLKKYHQHSPFQKRFISTIWCPKQGQDLPQNCLGMNINIKLLMIREIGQIICLFEGYRSL